MKIVVTGSLGNISKPLTQKLVQQGHSVTVISSKPEKKMAIEALGAKAAIGTIENVDFLKKTFAGADAVYCMVPPFNFLDAQLDIMEATRRLFGNYAQAIIVSGVKKVIHLSSVGAHTQQGNGVLAFHNLAEKVLGELPADIIVKHMRPVGFYTNLYNFQDMIKGKGFLGMFLTLRFSGWLSFMRGERGIIAANYGAGDIMPWVAPADIATAISEELNTPFVERAIRYIASEELSCHEIAAVIGEAIGKPYLKWVLMSDKDMLGGLKMFGMPEKHAQGLVDMNAGMHNGMVYENYYRNKPKVLGETKMKDFAREFAAAINSQV